MLCETFATLIQPWHVPGQRGFRAFQILQGPGCFINTGRLAEKTLLLLARMMNVDSTRF